MKIAVTKSINCAHQLTGTEIHGHTYQVTAIYSGHAGMLGMVVPFESLRKSLGDVLATLDHRMLEDVIGIPATAERLANYIFTEMQLPSSMLTIRVKVGDDGYVETE